MISIFRKFRQKLISHLPTGKVGNQVTRYLIYALGEIFLVMIRKTSPFRDLKLVERTQLTKSLRAFRPARPAGGYGI